MGIDQKNSLMPPQMELNFDASDTRGEDNSSGKETLKSRNQEKAHAMEDVVRLLLKNEKEGHGYIRTSTRFLLQVADNVDDAAAKQIRYELDNVEHDKRTTYKHWRALIRGVIKKIENS